MPHSRAELAQSPRLTTGKDAESPGRSSGLAKAPARWDSWAPTGFTPRNRTPALPPTFRPRSGGVGGLDALQMTSGRMSDDWAGCVE